MFKSTHDLSDGFNLNDSQFHDYTLNVLRVSDTISVITKLSTVESIFNSLENLAHSNLAFYLITDDPMALEAEIFDFYTVERITCLQIHIFDVNGNIPYKSLSSYRFFLWFYYPYHFNLFN